MPISIKNGSIFDSKAEVLVCPVNCVGVMGKGLALEFKRRYPDECAEYFTACGARNMGPGGVLKANRVVFTATKDHWRFPSNITYVEGCLINISGWVQGEITWDCDSIAIPHAPEIAQVFDSGPLVKLSGIHTCPTCGRDDCDWRCWDE